MPGTTDFPVGNYAETTASLQEFRRIVRRPGALIAAPWTPG
jgi:hypothetical protein